MSAGITVLPDRSTRRTPAGAFTAAALPTSAITLPSTRMAPCSIAGEPSPMIRRAPSYSVACGCAWIVAAKSATETQRHRAFTEVILSQNNTKDTKDTVALFLAAGSPANCGAQLALESRVAPRRGEMAQRVV